MSGFVPSVESPMWMVGVGGYGMCTLFIKMYGRWK